MGAKGIGGAWLAGSLLAAVSASAEVDDWLAPLVKGQLWLDVRARYEYADIASGPEASHAATVRTRLGYGTKPWHGLSATIEMENVATPDDHAFWDGLPPGNGRSIVADPSITEVNQTFLLFQRDELGGSLAKLGRQRIALDDHRFVGNVGWRQNEQTYDAAFAETALGVEGLTVQYGYLAEVHRIFGNQGTEATRDFESNSHLVRMRYRAAPWLEAVAFGYRLDLRDSPTNSSNTYGLRATGAVTLSDAWSLGYQASWAWQEDGGTSGGRNPVDYAAHYALGDLALSWAPAGAIGGGYELLGSDGGAAQLTTPLATAHKFNGWSDAFLDNGGPNGLQDVYAYVAPKLPWKLQGRLVYHHFFSDERSRDLGYELDAVLSRPIGKYLDVLGKVAWYDGRGSAAPPDRIRAWLELTFTFQGP